MKRFRHNLPLQILVAVALGIGLGLLFPDGQLKALAELGKVVIHWVKLIAGPFLFLTVVASILEVEMSAEHGLRVSAIALFNTAIATVLGMGLAHLFLGNVRLAAVAIPLAQVKPPDIALDFGGWVKSLTPSSLFAPFVQNDILIIGLMAVLVGLALRRTHPRQLKYFAGIFEQIRAVPSVILGWLIALIPLAVATVVAGAVSEHGVEVFFSLFRYVGVVLLGFSLQVIFVYGTWVFLIAKIKPRVFWREARATIIYSFGVNSSLATLPLTLKTLSRLGVSSRSAALGAGVATNLNNDGIVLYEALAVYFIAQMNHIQLSYAQMGSAALACIVAAMGITGIPEAGFISLTVVVSTLGLPAEALPLLLAVDWMLARGRSVVNVLSDMTLSIAMDATEPKRKR
jgi:Na+/H+-dicarboxylate symporter